MRPQSSMLKLYWRAGAVSMMERVNSGVGERNSHNIHLHTILGTPPVPSPLTPKSLV